MKYLNVLVLLGFMLPKAALASTFVGNGGSPGDVESTVTLRQLDETFQYIEKQSGDLCTCNPRFKNHSLCEALSTLTDEQHAYCSETLRAKAIDMERLAHDSQDASAIRIEWTHEPIDVQDSTDGSLHKRAAEAVANVGYHTITINQEEFLHMESYDRVFLLAHELFHFTQTDGKPMTDSGAIGPFGSVDGSRQLINAMATAVVMRAEDAGIFKKYRGTLNRAQGWKRLWVDLDVSDTELIGSAGGPFAMSRFDGGALSFRYYPFDTFGFIAKATFLTQSKTILSTIDATETRSVFGLGVSYRVFPFKNPLSIWGQSHFVINGMLEYLQSKYTYSDDFGVGDTESTSAWGESLSCIYYLPVWKFWTHLGVAIAEHDYQYSDLNVNYDKPEISTSLGVSYGF